MGFTNKLIHAWNAFTDKSTEQFNSWSTYGQSYGLRPDRPRMRATNDKSIIASIYNQIGIDVAGVDIRHVNLDDEERFVSYRKSKLDKCLTKSANIDEGARAFKQNMAMTLFEQGTIAIVPVDTSGDPFLSDNYEVKTLRVGEIVSWYPEHVRVSVYNEKTGRKEEITLSKRFVAVVENPLYAVMNETSGTLQRLIRKLALLDSIDEQVGSGKLDLIIQLPYVVKSEARKQQAEQRRKDIEVQLQGSKYGIAYTDGTERITQLNRPAENNMLKQVEFLTSQLYAQLGLTEEVFRGTADEKTMLNYYNRTIEPILTAITQAMERVFISKTGQTQGQAIRFFRDPFKLLSLSDVAELADKLIRNEIMTANEFRAVLGLKPSPDAKADQLRNPNMPLETPPEETT